MKIWKFNPAEYVFGWDDVVIRHKGPLVFSISSSFLFICLTRGMSNVCWFRIIVVMPVLFVLSSTKGFIY